MTGNLAYNILGATQKYTEALNASIENLSNINSVGYKKTEASFAQTLNGEVEKYESKDFSQGPVRKTTEPLDIALNGPGFLEVDLPNGQRAFTRAGRLKLNNEGELVTEDGYKVIPETEQEGSIGAKVENNELGVNIKVTSPKLLVPANSNVEITEDGTISGINPTSGDKSKFGKLSIVVFNNPSGLEAVGKGYYVQTKASGNAQDIEAGSMKSTQVKQGFLEYGNTNIAGEFINLAQLKNILTAHLKLLKVIDKIQENIHFTISKSV